jgi:hypothetical protein
MTLFAVSAIAAPLCATNPFGSSLNQVEVIGSYALPNIPGKRVTVVRVSYGGDMRSTIRALANDYLESEVTELMKAVSHAYVRGRFHTYSG